MYGKQSNNGASQLQQLKNKGSCKTYAEPKTPPFFMTKRIFGSNTENTQNLYFPCRIICAVLGELGNDPAERMLSGIDPANLNQVILAEGKHK